MTNKESLSVPPPVDAGPALPHEVLLKQWQEYESVTMHFNDLLMRFRTQATGGMAALAAFGGTVERVPWAWLLMALSVIWVALWVLDRLYYRRLLFGAASALRALERQSAGTIRFSLEIDEFVSGRMTRTRAKTNRIDGNSAPDVFYGLILLLLAVGAWVVWPRLECP